MFRSIFLTTVLWTVLVGPLAAIAVTGRSQQPEFHGLQSSCAYSDTTCVTTADRSASIGRAR